MSPSFVSIDKALYNVALAVSVDCRIFALKDQTLLRLRLWVLMLAIGISGIVLVGARWLGDYLTPPALRWHRVWDGEKWIDIHPAAWPNHLLNPNCPK
jgi:hypothetical protein